MKAMWQRALQSGPFWMVVAGLCFGVMGVFVKLGSRDFSTAELVFYRCLAGLVGILLVVLPSGRRVWVGATALRFHLSRGISGFVALMLYFYAIAHLPLSTAVTLNYTSPIFLMLVTLTWQKQPVTRRHVLTLLTGFAGVVLLLQPVLTPDLWLACLIGLGSGFLASIAYINVHELGRIGEPEWRTVFYFSLISTIGAAMLMALQSAPLTAITAHNWWIILGMGVAATLAQLAMTRAYRKGKSLVVASLAYLTVLFATLFGVVLWGDVLTSTALLGMAAIVGAGVMATYRRAT
ncbi:DMT family transporter [Chitinibacteraceae bacterium HSL-7]